MIQNLIMTMRGHKEMTLKCLSGLMYTISQNPQDELNLIIVDGSESEDRLKFSDLEDLDALDGKITWWQNRFCYLVILNFPKCSSPAGLNKGIRFVQEVICDNNYEKMEMHNIWLLNNDIVFKRNGWLELLCNVSPNTKEVGIIGSTAMPVFGHRFVDGGIWGFNLHNGFIIADHKDAYSNYIQYLDESLKYCCVDVDMSIRMTKLGLKNVVAQGLEHTEDPYFVHLVSQTTYGNEGEAVVLEKRKPEFRYLVDKHGRLDGKELYDGI